MGRWSLFDQRHLIVPTVYVDDDNLAYALEKLTKRQKEVIGCVFVMGMKPGEVADMLGVKPHTVYTLKNRTLKTIKNKWKGDAVEKQYKYSDADVIR